MILVKLPCSILGLHGSTTNYRHGPEIPTHTHYPPRNPLTYTLPPRTPVSCTLPPRSPGSTLAYRGTAAPPQSAADFSRSAATFSRRATASSRSAASFRSAAASSRNSAASFRSAAASDRSAAASHVRQVSVKTSSSLVPSFRAPKTSSAGGPPATQRSSFFSPSPLLHLKSSSGGKIMVRLSRDEEDRASTRPTRLL